MEKIDPDLVDNQLIFPDDEMLAKTFDFMPLDEAADHPVRRRVRPMSQVAEAPSSGSDAPADASAYDGLRAARS